VPSAGAADAIGVGATVAGRFHIERELGAGGMALVYLAEDLRHRRKVAVKVLRPELTATLAAERFLREIEISAQLLHPHILTLLDSGETSGDLYYVMPYVSGESLRARLDRAGELPLDEGLRIIRAVADALAYAHEHGVIHRDIKPENVLIMGDGAPHTTPRAHALVADFGVAKAVWAAGRSFDGRPLTTLGVALGTPAYMAPEQAAADPLADHRVDIYSLGVLAYELLGGTPPFAGASPQQIMAAHVTQTPEPLSKVRPAVPRALEHLVMRCLEKRPADRWQSADEFLRRLDTLAVSDRGSVAPMLTGPQPADATFRLSEGVCRLLTRATLDARVIGDAVHYRDNGVTSEVLVCFLPGCGQDGSAFEPALRHVPYHAIAVTQYGFEPVARHRVPLSLDDHGTLVRALVADVAARTRPSRTILAGFSSGGDLAMRLLARPDAQPPLSVDGVLALAPNLGIETCFVSRVMAHVSDSPSRMLADVQMISRSVDTLDLWVDIHEYLVNTIRRFRGDAEALRRFAGDVVEVFERGDPNPFIGWFRAVTATIRCLRCVFDDSEANVRLVQELRLQNLDSGILGPNYEEESLVIETGKDHFDLLDPELIARQLERVLSTLT
jgi:pimeloyl-ACP methyl ester carboxylesterase